MEAELFRWIRFERKFFPGTVWLAVLSFRFDRKWSENKNAGLRFRRAELTLRWPRPIKFHLDLVRYPEGSRLERHIDPVYEGIRQFNLILILRAAEKGGELVSDGFVHNGRRLKIIEPDRFEHEVTRVEAGERIVANLGIRFALRKIPPPF